MFDRGGGGGSRGSQRYGSNGPGFGKLLGALPIELVCVCAFVPRCDCLAFAFRSICGHGHEFHVTAALCAQVVVTLALLSNKALTPMPGPGRPDHTLNAHNTDTTQQALHHMEHRS